MSRGTYVVVGGCVVQCSAGRRSAGRRTRKKGGFGGTREGVGIKGTGGGEEESITFITAVRQRPCVHEYSRPSQIPP
jgi:hypothetical protein